MARNLARLGIGTVRDLLFHLPRRYDDFSHPMTLRELRDKPPEGPVSATVEIVDLRVEQGFRRRVQRTVARLKDDTGEGEAVWFGRRYIERRLAAGQTVALSGKVELRGWLPSFKNPEFGPAGDDALHAGRIVPVYRLTAGVLGPTLRTKIRAALDLALPVLTDYLPPDIRREAGDNLPEITKAVEAVHFPPDFAERDRALRRLAFDELFALQLGMVARQRQRRTEAAISIPITDEQLATGIAAVERVIGEQVARRRALAGDASADDAVVHLTIDQLSAVDDIRSDLATGRPMMRLLQGDVGSGKTAVAALALAFAADAGHQGALLAPTDLLARQHAQTLGRLLEPLGHDVTLLTGSLNAAARREVLDLLGAPVEKTLDGRTRGRSRRRHARARPGSRRVPGPAPGGSRRAASIWGCRARGADQQGWRAARAAHDGDAHPAHTGPDRACRSRRLGPAHAAGWATGDRHGHPCDDGAHSPWRRQIRARCR